MFERIFLPVVIMSGSELFSVENRDELSHAHGSDIVGMVVCGCYVVLTMCRRIVRLQTHPGQTNLKKRVTSK